MNIENLQKLIDYLKEGNLKARFDMESFADEDHEENAAICGTAGCAIGHAAFVFKKPKKEDWEDFSERIFGISALYNHTEWEFLFGIQWFRDTPEGKYRETQPKPESVQLQEFIQRAEYAIEHGIPKKWDYRWHEEQ